MPHSLEVGGTHVLASSCQEDGLWGNSSVFPSHLQTHLPNSNSGDSMGCVLLHHIPDASMPMENEQWDPYEILGFSEVGTISHTGHRNVYETVSMVTGRLATMWNKCLFTIFLVV